MVNLVRILQIERELILEKIEKLNNNLGNGSTRVLLHDEKNILDLWKAHERKLHVIFDTIKNSLDMKKHQIRSNIHKDFIKEIKTRLCESEFYLTLINESYLKEESSDVLCIQSVPEWYDFDQEERCGGNMEGFENEK